CCSGRRYSESAKRSGHSDCILALGCFTGYGGNRRAYGIPDRDGPLRYRCRRRHGGRPSFPRSSGHRGVQGQAHPLLSRQCCPRPSLRETPRPYALGHAGALPYPRRQTPTPLFRPWTVQRERSSRLLSTVPGSTDRQGHTVDLCPLWHTVSGEPGRRGRKFGIGELKKIANWVIHGAQYTGGPMLAANVKTDVIDSDAHVVENERVWDYLGAGEEKYRPALVAEPDNPERQHWILDGEDLGPKFPSPNEKQSEEHVKRFGREVGT